MTASLIIFVAMVAVWFYLSHRLRLPDGAGFSFDVAGQQWSFMGIYDRYCFVMREILWVTLIAIGAAVYSHNSTAFWLLLVALVDNLLLRGLMLFWYEAFTHASYTQRGAVRKFVYSPRKYALVLTLAVALPIYFFIGLLLAGMMF